MTKGIFLSMAFICIVMFTNAQHTITSNDVKIEISKRTNVEVLDEGIILAKISEKDIARITGKGFIQYGDMGAIGNGQSDDMAYIVATHAIANEYGLSVQANKDACYYIGGYAMTAIIGTSTNFGTAKFSIDDTMLENRRTSVFKISSGRKPFQLNKVESLKKNQKQLDITLPCSCLVTVKNSNVKQYIRMGLNKNSGKDQTDIFIVDKHGMVDMKSPIIWDFDEITDMSILPISNSILNIQGGTFISIANQDSSKYNYHNRNIEINRSNVIVDGLRHEIKGEKDHGAPYNGFIYIHDCANVTIKNSVFTAHRTYKTIGSAGKEVSMGSYDIIVNRALYVSFINCKQTNDIMDVDYWGIMGSNYSKNLLLDNCSFSRFDAHMGVANATIRNSSLGYMGINAIGCGTFTVENTTIRGRSLINLRKDYGSTWNGKIVIRNCIFAPRQDQLNSASIIGGYYSGNHNFGYTCHMPRYIHIENLKVIDSRYNEDYMGISIFADFNTNITNSNYKDLYPYEKTQKVLISNIKTTSGKPLIISKNKYMFNNVEIEYLN